jgi:two-component system sensor histidine kinase PhoQ
MVTLSFRRRLIIVNVALAFLLLPAFHFGLMSAFNQQALLSEQQALEAYSYNLMAGTDIDEQGLLMPIELDGPSFDIPESGWYAFIRSADGDILWSSNSFLPMQESLEFVSSALGVPVFTALVLNGDSHFNWQLKVAYEKEQLNIPLTFHIVKSKDDYQQRVAVFKQKLWLWLLVIATILFISQVFWIRWFERPLTRLRGEIEAVEKGKLDKVSQRYPKELNALNDSLNRLILTESQQRERYKNTLSDLAHSLKTPLAVAKNDATLSATTAEELDKIDAIITRQLTRASSGQTSWQTGCNLKPIVENTVQGLQKLYADKHIVFNVQCEQQVIFYGAQADAFEILGALIDNACKACARQVNIDINSLGANVDDNTYGRAKLSIQVSDDGDGIEEQQIGNILKRGYRADSYEQGHGLGLAVVQDIVKTYEGKLEVCGQSELGGAIFTVTI